MTARFRIALIATLGLAGCRADPTAAQPVELPPVSGPARVGPPATPVAARYIGVVTTTEAVDLAPSIEAPLLEITVRPGDEVIAGQVIAELDPRAARRDLLIGEAALDEAQAAKRAGDVEVRNASRVLASERRALKAGITPREDVDDARAAVDRARAARDRAEASVKEARAQVDALRVLVDDTTVRAPFDGVIALRYREVGDVAGPRSPVVRLHKRDGLRLRFGVPPDDARTLRTGQRVTADLDTLPGSFDAVIEHIAPDVDAPSRLVFVDAVLEIDANATTTLQPGLAAHVSLR